MDRIQQLKTLFGVLVQTNTNRKVGYPEVAAQFHIDWFVQQFKKSEYFDQLLQDEIEDCSRCLEKA